MFFIIQPKAGKRQQPGILMQGPHQSEPEKLSKMSCSFSFACFLAASKSVSQTGEDNNMHMLMPGNNAFMSIKLNMSKKGK